MNVYSEQFVYDRNTTLEHVYHVIQINQSKLNSGTTVVTAVQEYS